MFRAREVPSTVKQTVAGRCQCMHACIQVYRQAATCCCCRLCCCCLDYSLTANAIPAGATAAATTAAAEVQHYGDGRVRCSPSGRQRPSVLRGLFAAAAAGGFVCAGAVVGSAVLLTLLADRNSAKSAWCFLLVLVLLSCCCSRFSNSSMTADSPCLRTLSGIICLAVAVGFLYTTRPPPCRLHSPWGPPARRRGPRGAPRKPRHWPAASASGSSCLSISRGARGASDASSQKPLRAEEAAATEASILFRRTERRRAAAGLLQLSQQRTVPAAAVAAAAAAAPVAAAGV